jgi:chromosome segregation ATPase
LSTREPILVPGAPLSYQTRRASGEAFGMAKLVGICVILFMLAVGFLIATAGPDLAALVAALRAEPVLDKVAWAVIVLVPLVLLPAAVWLTDTLVRQRKAAQALELRLDGVRQGVKELAKSQIDAEAAVHHLARTDPEDAIGAVQQRLGDAERAALVQQQRNEIGDLQSHVDAIRGQQQALRQRLAPVLEKRRAIEQLFLELDTSQNDVERALAEIASGDDATALDLRLKKLTEFVRQCHERCDGIESASKTIADLKEAYAELQARLAPFAAAKGGVTSRIKALSEARDRLAADIDALARTPQGPLAERVKGFADDKARLDDDVAQLNVQFSKLATLHDDIDGLTEKLESALGIIAPDGKADIDARIKDVAAFVATTQADLKDIEDRLAVFGQLKTRLGELQGRLVPLEAGDSGVLSLVAQVQDIRDKLAARVARLEAGEGGDLAERVKTFTDAKRELEERVAVVTDHFSKLATVRKDLAGLFEKLSSAANTN